MGVLLLFVRCPHEPIYRPAMVANLGVRLSRLVTKEWVMESSRQGVFVLKKVPWLFLNSDMRARTFELGVLWNGPGTKEVQMFRLNVILPMIIWKATRPLVAASVLVHSRLTLRRLGLFLRRSNLIETFTDLSSATVRW